MSTLKSYRGGPWCLSKARIRVVCNQQKEPPEVENMAKLRQGGMDGARWLKSNSNWLNVCQGFNSFYPHPTHIVTVQHAEYNKGSH